ncbi:hypothetical protein [uncultured Lacinutrix sp.]|uniref:hypothetical protein n=1 Tax=uncultured Lacinutrix sp. TaxID=574032 RepID=UPI0026048AEB|nr:hypothetical protein [uncultured Lacinutrix sp.]
MLFFKFKAGALQLTLFIVVIIALLLAGFILFTHIHNRFKVQTSFVIETITNANKGIDYFLLNNIKTNDTTAVKLNEEDYKTLKLVHSSWGVFEKVVSISKIKTNSLKKVALIGAIQPELYRTALYIQDNNKPLVLVGNTKIEGLAYLPERGVKSGTISGQSYYGTQLIYGPTKIASNLPSLNTEIEKQCAAFKNLIKTINPKQLIAIDPGKSYTNSFLEPLQMVYSNSAIRLNNNRFIGHIIIQSKTKIIVDNTAILKDVILIAPDIEIQSNVNGNFQAIATKNIIIGKNSNLKYPSSLVLIEEETINVVNKGTNKNVNHIKIDANSKVKGIVLFKGETQKSNYKANIEIEKGAIIYGEVYCNENTELEGKIYGSIFTNNFVANQFGSIYQNHIYNGTIIVDNLQQEYVGLLFKNSKKGIVKWLY